MKCSNILHRGHTRQTQLVLIILYEVSEWELSGCYVSGHNSRLKKLVSKFYFDHFHFRTHFLKTIIELSK